MVWFFMSFASPIGDTRLFTSTMLTSRIVIRAISSPLTPRWARLDTRYYRLYAYTSPQTGSVPIFNIMPFYMALRVGDMPCQQEPTCSWLTREAYLLCVYKTIQRDRPVYRYHVVQANGFWRFYFSTDPSLIQT